MPTVQILNLIVKEQRNKINKMAEGLHKYFI